jgi:leader peptidase (prepilin peptidase)/N-methyltransferase
MHALLGGLGAVAGACGALVLRPSVLRRTAAGGMRPAHAVPAVAAPATAPTAPTALTALTASPPTAPTALTAPTAPVPAPTASTALGALTSLTALAAAVLAAVRGPGWDTASLVVWTITGCALAVLDLATFRLPDRLTLPLYPVTIVLLALAAGARHEVTPLLRAAAGMLVLLAGFAALIALRPGQLGLGDLKLAGSLGLVLGWLGWRCLLFGVFTAFALAALFGLATLLPWRARQAPGRARPPALRHRLRAPLPFGPFLVAGGWWAMLLAPC